ncbi:MAG TPA: hypothetical protein VEX86_27220 [Longimicrobium sp.]|nr:hypothetical protein [Longimicrobium sp.]
MSFVTRGMVRGGVLAAAGLCACAPLSPRQMDEGVFTSEGVASITSFECSREAVSGLGYTVSWSDGAESLRGEKRSGDGSEGWRGYLTVSVSHAGAGAVLAVSAERFTESSRVPIATRPTPQPTPVPTPVPMPRPAQRSSRRVNPGPVASDARSVVRRCAMNGERSFAVR